MFSKESRLGEVREWHRRRRWALCACSPLSWLQEVMGATTSRARGSHGSENAPLVPPGYRTALPLASRHLSQPVTPPYLANSLPWVVGQEEGVSLEFELSLYVSSFPHRYLVPVGKPEVSGSLLCPHSLPSSISFPGILCCVSEDFLVM